MPRRHLTVACRASSTSFIIYQPHPSSSVIIILLSPSFFQATSPSSFQVCDFRDFAAAAVFCFWQAALAAGLHRYIHGHPGADRSFPRPRYADMVYFLCFTFEDVAICNSPAQLPSVLPGVECEWECHCPRLWGDASRMRKATGPRVEGDGVFPNAACSL